MLPGGALVKAGDSAFAWRLKERASLQKVAVKLGPRDARSGQYEVRSGLAAGDLVLRSVSSSFTDGQKVEMASPAKVASANAGQPAAQGK